MQFLEIIWLAWGKQQQASCRGTGCGSAGCAGQLQSEHFYSSSPGPGKMHPASLEESHPSRWTTHSSLDFLQLLSIALRPSNSQTFSKDTTSPSSEQYSVINSLTCCGSLPFVFIYSTTLPSALMQVANYVNNVLILKYLLQVQFMYSRNSCRPDKCPVEMV